MKIKFDLDDELPINKTIEICRMIILVKVVSHGNNKHYPQVFLDKLLMLLKELMLIKLANQKSAIFVINFIFNNKGFKLQPSICNKCL